MRNFSFHLEQNKDNNHSNEISFKTKWIEIPNVAL